VLRAGSGSRSDSSGSRWGARPFRGSSSGVARSSRPAIAIAARGLVMLASTPHAAVRAAMAALLLTGLTRDGVYLIENGEVTGAVNNFRFNESPVGMLGRLLEVGATQKTLPREWGDYFNRAAMPALRVDAFNMSSVSQAS